MKFIVDKKKMEAACAPLNRIASRSVDQRMQLIHGRLEGGENGSLAMTATDGQNTLRLEVQCKSEDNGEFIVEAARLCPLFKELPDGEIAITVTDGSLIMDWKNGGYQGGIASDGVFPPVPKIGRKKENPIHTIALSAEDIGMIVQGVSPAADDKDDLRPVTGGIFFDADSNGVTVVGTDGQMLLTRAVCEGEHRPDAFSFLVPKAAIAILASVMPKDMAEVKLNSDGIVFSCSGDGFNVTSLCIDKQFPAYRTVMRDSGKRLTVNRKDLRAAVRRVAVITASNDAKDTLLLTFDEGAGDKVRIGAQNLLSQSAVVETLPCTWDGGKMVIGFHVQKMIAALDTTSSENVTFIIDAPNRPVMFLPDEDPEARGVLMPAPVKEFPELSPKKKGKKA